MEQAEHLALKRRELVDVAKGMLAGEVHLIEGVRRICSLRFDVGDPENEVFLPIRGIESETDTFPLGTMRSSCSQEYLQRMDAEMEDYLAEAKADILRASEEIVRIFS